MASFIAVILLICRDWYDFPGWGGGTSNHIWWTMSSMQIYSKIISLQKTFKPKLLLVSSTICWGLIQGTWPELAFCRYISCILTVMYLLFNWFLYDYVERELKYKFTNVAQFFATIGTYISMYVMNDSMYGIYICVYTSFCPGTSKTKKSQKCRYRYFYHHKLLRLDS